MPHDHHRIKTAAVNPDAGRMLAQAAAAREHSHWLRHGYDPPDQP